jgi:hypothetical protein
MSIVTGKITAGGAVVDVLVGVSKNREAVLKSAGFPVPAKIALRAEIDTGSAVTGLIPEAFQQLGVEPFRRILIRTPSTRRGAPCKCDQYDISLTLVAGMAQVIIPSVHAIASEDFGPEEDIQALIGRDVLQHCVFNYYGQHGEFALAF